MPKVQFRGRVLPVDPIRVSIDVIPVNWKSPENGLDLTLKVTIKDSVVTVDCDINRLDQEAFAYMYFRALDLARTPIDLMALSKGVGLIVILEHIHYEDGRVEPIVAVDAHLASAWTAFDMTPERAVDFGKVLQLALTTPPLFMALNDLVSGMIWPHYAPRVAAQAVETVRILLAPPGVEPKNASWRNLRDRLRVSEEYLKFVTETGTGPRHGDRTFISPQTLREQGFRAFTVVNRYLEYKLRDDALPEDQFPML